ncbi:MAG TPA: D-aminoacyl-tRNA deacylase [Clostridiales bacterium]|nr:D-aminoacyl-tRNA deacylase [Clostridiales bacterium]
MRVLLQRVKSASVTAEGSLTGEIGTGLLLYIGVGVDDGEADLAFIAGKIPHLRIFPDENDKMNLSLQDIGGAMLAVSQFTLMGDCAHGRRPGFSGAMRPEQAKEFYERLVALWRQQGIPVACGVFQGDMLVTSVNWGPVTFMLDSKVR